MRSYPKVWNLGHKVIADLFKDEVLIEEKIDGSQFSFGIYDGEIQCESHNQELIVEVPETQGMFKKAVETVKEIAPLLKNNWTYRGEFLGKPKQNVLFYERVPNKHIIIFDIDAGLEKYLSYEQKVEEVHRIGLECVQSFGVKKINDPESVFDLLENISMLGNVKLEGIVFKNYSRFDEYTGKALMGKYVSSKFREQHDKQFKAERQTQGNILTLLIEKYKTEARWQKALQHLKEEGKITGSLKDIGLLMKEVPNDILEECKEEIKDTLFKWAWNDMRKRLTAKLPEWYKEVLLKKQFDKEER